MTYKSYDLAESQEQEIDYAGIDNFIDPLLAYVVNKLQIQGKRLMKSYIIKSLKDLLYSIYLFV